MDATSPELPYWLALNRAPRIGPVAFAALLDAFETPRGVFEAGSKTLRECGVPAAAVDFLARPDWRPHELHAGLYGLAANVLVLGLWTALLPAEPEGEEAEFLEVAGTPGE